MRRVGDLVWFVCDGLLHVPLRGPLWSTGTLNTLRPDCLIKYPSVHLQGAAPSSV